MSVFTLLFQNRHSKLGMLTLDVLTSETITLPSEVTMYPVEDGGPDITDHITQKNIELNIEGSISGTTSFGVEFYGQCGSKLISAVDTLAKMHRDRRVFMIETGLMRYENMAFTNISITRQAGDKGGQWLDISAQLRNIRKVSLKEAELPAEKASKTSGADGKTGKTEPRGSPPNTNAKEQYGPTERPKTWLKDYKTDPGKYKELLKPITG